MTHVPHKLTEAFPEYAKQLHFLKLDNAHFRHLAHEYDTVNREIHLGETRIQPMSDFHLEDLKKTRLKLLDGIKRMLN
ncbi:MAG: DUF465 domain-containing protein [Pseudomonadota bacterium]